MSKAAAYSSLLKEIEQTDEEAFASQEAVQGGSDLGPHWDDFRGEQLRSFGSEADLRKQVVTALDAASAFEEQRRAERLRQARWSFNAALALIIIGTLIVLVGVALLLRSFITAGIASSAAGVVSNVASAVLFKFNKDANDRLDKIKVKLAKIESYRKTVELLDHVEPEADSTFSK